MEGYVAKGGSKTFNFVSKYGEAVIPPEQNIDILSKEMDDFYLATDSSIPGKKLEIFDSMFFYFFRIQFHSHEY